MDYSALIQYFRNCFEIDNRNFIINDLFKSSNCTHFFEKEELINKESPIAPIPESVFKDFSKLIKLHSAEGKLYYFSYILRGETIQNNRKIKLFTPLYLFEAKIFQKGEFFYAELLSHIPVVNQSSFQEFVKNPEDKIFIENVFNQLEGLIDYKDIPILFDEYFDDINNNTCMNFPSLNNEEEMIKVYKSRAKKYADENHLIPAGGLCFIRDKSEVKGVLGELQHIASKDLNNTALLELLNEKEISRFSFLKSNTSSHLNASQKKAVENAKKYGLSYVIGPPGTGKSYTVAGIALDHLLQGKAVLIVSKTDEAVDVIKDILENKYHLHSSIFRTGQKNYLSDIKEQLDDLLNNVVENSYSKKIGTEYDNLIKHQKSNKKAEKTEKEFIELSDKLREYSNKYFELDGESGLLNKIRFELLKYRYNGKSSIYSKLEKLHHELKQNEILTKKHVESYLNWKKFDLIENDRHMIKNVKKSFSSRSASKRELLQEQIDYYPLLNAFPIWMVKLKDIYKSIPLKKNLFDLVIIDEATQCDIASTLPILYRAEKAVIAGDPKQIRHISFVSKSKQNALYELYNLDQYKHLEEEFFDYRNKSIIDVISEKIDTNDQIAFLNEHFRSLPAIIQFSNEEFYSNALQIMTTKPELHPTEGLHFHEISGAQNSEGHNIEEADFIWKKIQDIIDREKSLPFHLSTSIGILSPFRKQTDYLEERLLETFPYEIIQKHRIMVGTSYVFQGNERDTMFISMALDNSSHAMAFSYLNKPELLNVAITRARSNQHIVYSFDYTKISQKNRIRRYFEYYSSLSVQSVKSEYQDQFLSELIACVEGKVDNLWPSYSMSGVLMDLLVKKGDKYFGFDLIGFPGDFEEIYSIERYKVFHRIGISIFPISYIEWKENKEETIEAISSFLK
ncbi:MAG: DNA2/NAM7 family helicase [Crocinitomicaceae bacterium]|nr:DNA2/NAM7 family helicase [Crocinitomicaceae bacterium]